jgi:DNA helicase HerA-like ATPase
VTVAARKSKPEELAQLAQEILSMTPDTTEQAGKILVGKSDKFEYLTLAFGNRHGLITGATGTGKTVTLQTLAEGFSRAGVTVFAADVKGDLAGLAKPGGAMPAMAQRAADLGLGFVAEPAPVVFWDLFGEQGHPIRATVSQMGPLLVSQLLGLNETQEGVLNIAFRIADEEGLLLLDLKDLRALLEYLAQNARQLTTRYGNVAPATIGAIQRQLLVLESQGGDRFFGEPALEIADFVRLDSNGHGIINLLAAERLMRAPRLYATFLLWLLSELFEQMPEAGDPEQPHLVFFFDEAHLLFKDASKPVLAAIERTVRLIRSKGVGVYFVTQNPLDIPEAVLGQLGNRIQHALRAFTPRDQKAVNAAATTFRANPAFNTAEVITQLAVGEALVSMLGGKGIPEVVSRTLIAPPRSRVGPLDPAERRALIAASPLGGAYDVTLDRESAFEILRDRAKADAAAASVPGRAAPNRGRMSTGEIAVRSAVQSAARSIGTQVARVVLRGILGGMRR